MSVFIESKKCLENLISKTTERVIKYKYRLNFKEMTEKEKFESYIIDLVIEEHSKSFNEISDYDIFDIQF